eukprot:1178051-Prorocentrum_minimum.AAC.4
MDATSAVSQVAQGGLRQRARLQHQRPAAAQTGPQHPRPAHPRRLSLKTLTITYHLQKALKYHISIQTLHRQGLDILELPILLDSWLRKLINNALESKFVEPNPLVRGSRGGAALRVFASFCLSNEAGTNHGRGGRIYPQRAPIMGGKREYNQLDCLLCSRFKRHVVDMEKRLSRKGRKGSSTKGADVDANGAINGAPSLPLARPHGRGLRMPVAWIELVVKQGEQPD